MKRQSFINVIVIISLFLLLFSALSVVVLYVGQTIQQPNNIDINNMIAQELSGSNVIINNSGNAITGTVDTSGSAVVLP